MKRKTDRRIDDYKEDILRDTIGLIAIESVTGDLLGNRRALDFVLKRAEALGMRSGKTKTGDVGWAEIGDGDQTVGILAHVDVVGVGDLQKWSRPPFEGYVADGFLWGRGSVDDKGPIIMSLYAMKALLDAGLPLKKKIRLIIGTQEESQWTDMEHYKEEFGPADYGFSPDGDFPVYNIEKGYCDVELLFEASKALPLEVLQAGDSPNTIPSSARLQFAGQQERVFHGISAHSSTPELADNAILRMAEAVEGRGLPAMDFLCRFFLPGSVALSIDDGEGHYKGVYVGKTTAAPTIAELRGNKVFLNINIRHRAGTTAAEIARAFDRFAGEYGYSLRLADYSDALMVDESLPHLQQMKGVYEEYGYKNAFLVADGASYAKTMKNFVCWGPVFPGQLSCAHMEDEKLSVDAMLTATKIYAAFLADTAGE